MPEQTYHPICMSTREHFLEQIEAFLAESGMSAGRFGELAMGDRAFLHSLRKGRVPMLDTVDKVHAFIEAERAKLRKSKKKPRPEPSLSAA